MGKFNSSKKLILGKKQEFLIKEFTLSLKIQISKKTLISLDKLDGLQFLYRQILLKDLREILIKSLSTFYMLQKLPLEKFVLNYI